MGTISTSMARLLHNQAIYAQINVFQEIINKCEKCKVDFMTQKTKMQGTFSELEMAYNRGTSTKIGDEIVIEEVYEGITAEAIKNKKEEFVTGMHENQTAMADIISEIGTSIEKLDEYIEILQMRIEDLRSQLW